MYHSIRDMQKTMTHQRFEGETMKKLITLLLLASLVMLPACSGDKGNVETTGAQTTAAPVEKDIDIKRDGNMGDLKIHLPNEANTTLTLLVISDLSIESDWKSHPDMVYDIGEVTLDENGRASTTLSLASDGTLYLILTGANGVRREEIPAAK